jgi:hypothetical protein
MPAAAPKNIRQLQGSSWSDEYIRHSAGKPSFSDNSLGTIVASPQKGETKETKKGLDHATKLKYPPQGAYCP